MNPNNDIANVIDAAMSGRKQSALAADLGWPESKVSEVKAALKKDGSVYLKQINLKVVPEDMVCVSKKKLETLVAFLQMAVPGLSLNQLTDE